MKQLITFICALLLAEACQSSRDGNFSGIYTINAAAAIDTSAEVMSLKKLSQSIKIVPLETTEASLIKSVNDILLYKDNIIILNGGKCSVFSKEGKFLTDIGQKGNGPQEYLMIENIFVGNDTIYLYDSYKNQIYKFTLDNKYISSFKIDSTLSDFRGIAMIGESDFVVFTPDKGFPTTHKFLTFFNTAGELKDSLLRVSKLSQPANINWYFKEGTFVQNEKELRYKDVFNDTIYTIETNAGKYLTTPKYIFNLGKYKAVENARERVKQSFFAPKMYDPFSEMAKIELLGENSRYLFFLANGQRQYFFDKEENQLHKWIFTLPGYEQECKEDPTFFIPLLIDQSGNLLGVMRGKEENDNPQIVIAKF